MQIENLVWVNPALKITINLNSYNLEEALGVTREDIKRLVDKQTEITKQLYPDSDGRLTPPELVLIASACCATANELAWMMIRLGGFMIEEGAAEHAAKPGKGDSHAS